MHLEFVCSRIILPRFVFRASFRLLTEYNSCQELPKKTKHIRKNKTPVEKDDNSAGVFCFLLSGVEQFWEFFVQFCKQFVHLLKILRKVHKHCAKVEKVSCPLWKV